jgi:hypothetical protein
VWQIQYTQTAAKSIFKLNPSAGKELKRKSKSYALALI